MVSKPILTMQCLEDNMLSIPRPLHRGLFLCYNIKGETEWSLYHFCFSHPNNKTLMEYSNQELKLREDVLGLLLKNFGNTSSNKNIYECANDLILLYKNREY